MLFSYFLIFIFISKPSAAIANGIEKRVTRKRFKKVEFNPGKIRFFRIFR